MSGLEQHASGSSNPYGGGSGGGLPRAAGNNRPAQSHNLQSHNINTPLEECTGHCCKPARAPNDAMLTYGYANGYHMLPPMLLPHLNSPPSWPPAVPSSMAAMNLQQQQQPPPAQPVGHNPSAISVNLAPDAPEDAALVAQNLVDMLQLWEDWHLFSARDLQGDQAASELKRLASRTVSIAGAATQGSLNRQQMVELLQYATGVLQDHERGSDAEYLAVLADKMAAVPSRGGALFQNIQNGGRQSVTGGAQTMLSRPSVRAALSAKNDADARAKSGSSALARARAFLEHRGGGWLGLAATAAAGAVCIELLKRCAGRTALASGGAYSGPPPQEERCMRRRHESSERRRIQCEAANQRAREYLKELRDNRANPMWHKDPPPDTCPMPPENLPWRPFADDWGLL